MRSVIITSEQNKILTDYNLLCSLILKKHKLACYLIYQGTDVLKYHFWYKGIELFSGNDFKPSPLHNIDDLESVVELLSFLTVRVGEVDINYFLHYNQEQLNWTQSSECTSIRDLINDFNDKDSEYHTTTKKILKRAFKRY